MSIKPEFFENEIEIPSDVSITKKENLIITKGSFGSVQKDFALVNTLQSVINNMIKGSTKGFTYKLKIVFAHFPITVKIKGKEIFVDNFFGERSSRTSKIIGNDTKVTVQGEDIVISGSNIEYVSQTAANLELATRIKNKDSRVFLDGVYIYSKE
jgi:large subunit ribosomal protein L6